jgi:hypothetical protein
LRVEECATCNKELSAITGFATISPEGICEHLTRKAVRVMQIMQIVDRQLIFI